MRSRGVAAAAVVVACVEAAWLQESRGLVVADDGHLVLVVGQGAIIRSVGTEYEEKVEPSTIVSTKTGA